MKRLILLIFLSSSLNAWLQVEYPLRVSFGAGYAIPFSGKIETQPHQLDKYMTLLKPGPHFNIEIGWAFKNKIVLGVHVTGAGFEFDHESYSAFINSEYPHSYVYGPTIYYSSDYWGAAPKTRCVMANIKYAYSLESFIFSPYLSMGLRYFTDPRIKYIVRPNNTYTYSTYTLDKLPTVGFAGEFGVGFKFKRVPAFRFYAVYEYGWSNSKYRLTIEDSNMISTESNYSYKSYLGVFSFGLSLCFDQSTE